MRRIQERQVYSWIFDGRLSTSLQNEKGKRYIINLQRADNKLILWNLTKESNRTKMEKISEKINKKCEIGDMEWW